MRPPPSDPPEYPCGDAPPPLPELELELELLEPPSDDEEAARLEDEPLEALFSVPLRLVKAGRSGVLGLTRV